jgi:hypothetical protein
MKLRLEKRQQINRLGEVGRERRMRVSEIGHRPSRYPNTLSMSGAIFSGSTLGA